MGNNSLFLISQNETTNKCLYVPSLLQFIDYLRVVYITTCSINALFCPLAVFGNAVVFYSISRTQNLHDPAHLLLASLALTDLTVGLIQQPLYVIYKAAEINRLARISCIAGLLTNMLTGVLPGLSFLIVTLVTLDRYLALHLHLRYKAIVTRPLVIKVILVSLALFTVAVSFYPWKPRVSLFIAIATIPLFLFISTISYFKIYRIVRKHQRAISCQAPTQAPAGQDTINMRKFWRFVVSFSYVYFIMVACYFPYVVTLVFRSLVGMTKEYKVALNVTSTVIFINSSLNPIVYCWKIKEIRRAVFKTLEKITGSRLHINLQETTSNNHSVDRSRTANGRQNDDAKHAGHI